MRTGTALMMAGAASVGALLAGGKFNPGPEHPRTAVWYERLDKPSFTPPAPVFAVAWPILDGLLWFTGYRLLRAPVGPARRTSLITWLITLSGIPSYSWAFFGRHRADEGLGVSASMLAGSMALTASTARVDAKAAWATVPLIGWLIFASVLQEEVLRRNQ